MHHRISESASNRRQASSLLLSCCLQVDSRQEIAAGSAEEVEIRACTIAAVEALRRELSSRLQDNVAAAPTPLVAQTAAGIGGVATVGAASAADAAPVAACPPSGGPAAADAPGLAAGSEGGRALPNASTPAEAPAAAAAAAEAAAAAVGLSPEAAAGADVTAVAVDWWLWGRGEAERDTAPPHHRTLTIFY